MSPDTSSSSSFTSIQPELPVRVKLGATGHGLVEVDGIDLSGKVAALAFDARAGTTVNKLLLELVGDVDLEALAQVTVMRTGRKYAEVLAEVDAAALEAEALRRLEGFDDRSLTEVMLAVLGEWLTDGS
jgi:hypothetical protein